MGRHKSLGMKLVISFMGISMIPILLITMFSYYHILNIVNDNNKKLMKYNLSRTKTTLEISVESYQDILVQIYSDDDVVHLINKINRGEDLVVSKNHLRRILRAYLYAKDYIRDLSVITEDGTLVFYDSITGSITRSSWIPNLGIDQKQLYNKYIDENKEKGNVKLVTVVNFPLGTNSMDTTMVQVHEAVNEGVDEIDTVINLSAIKMGDYKKVSDEIKIQKGICDKRNLKVILEVDLLTRDEIKKACLNCITAGADFVKTSTGFLKDGLGATTENIRLMSDTVSRRGMGVKASGGIRTRVQAIDLINAGADRLGTSSGVAMVKY